jgi:hypothetical protein
VDIGVLGCFVSDGEATLERPLARLPPRQLPARTATPSVLTTAPPLGKTKAPVLARM